LSEGNRLPVPFVFTSRLAFPTNQSPPNLRTGGASRNPRSFALDGRHGIVEVRHDRGVHALETRIRFGEPLSLLPIVTRLRAMFDLGFS
jgi:AlkA N-terminal domain